MPSPLHLARHVRRALARRRDADAPLDGELNIVPFLDIITNLLLFLLATAGSVMVVAQVDAQLPITRRGPRGPSAPPPPSVSVTIVGSGVVVAGPGGFAGVGCESASSTYRVAVARRAGEVDWDALSACMARVRDAVPDDDRVVVSADPDVPYAELVHAMDAVRAHGARRLFSDVLLSAGVR